MSAKAHVFAVAQLPPPVTGLSAVNARMIRELREAGLLFASSDLSPPRNWPSALKPIGRFAKTLATALRLILVRAGGVHTLYMPCDGGSGLALNLLLATFARILGYSLWTHHHSFAYLNERSALMAAFLRFSPKETTHVALCDRMEALLLERYPLEWVASRAKVIVLSNAFMANAVEEHPRSDGELVLGHLSNLTEDKGALRFLDLFARLRRKGVAVRAQIAGPANESKVKAAIEATAAEFPDAFSWCGPVYGPEKDAFYEGVDVFVFPSSYANEAQPLVLLEALAHGAAIVTTDRGCMGCDHEESPGAVFGEADFDINAERWVEDLAKSFDRARLSQDATRRFSRLKEEADRTLAGVLSAI
jgi:glycosyltransferase involved in cell wall biosynthesis